MISRVRAFVRLPCFENVFENAMPTYGVIPARIQSTRLPRKLLLTETGKPLLQHTWEAALQSSALDQVVIATDSDEIADVARRFGAEVCMTGDHPSGTDRVAEVATKYSSADLIVNIQGDEPELAPENINKLVSVMSQHPSAEMATLAARLSQREQLESPANVKIARSEDGRALYFSRSAIPHCRDMNVDELLTSTNSPWLLHIGLYGYRAEFLQRMAAHAPTPLEQLEKLEQLRALEMGASLQVAIVQNHAPGVDTPEDYAAFVARYKQQ